MTSFIAIYRGTTVDDATLVAVSADPELVANIATALLRQNENADNPDPVLREIERGRQRALRLVTVDA